MASKTICLMRHSEAVAELSAHNITKDFDRPLTDNGIHQLEGVRDQLKALSFLPDVVLCSPSVRTRQTLEWIQEVLGADVNVEFDEALYGIDVSALIEKLYNLEDDKQCILIVGHNPSISDVIQRFFNKVPNNEVLPINFPIKPSQFVVFNIDTNSWQNILDASVTVNGLFEPS